jgi:O-antigen/teichoic acid export membrane protein
LLSFRRWVVFTFLVHLMVVLIDKSAGIVLLWIVGDQAPVKGAADLMTTVPFILMAVANLGLATSMIYFARRKEHDVQEIAETTSFVALVWGSLVGIAAYFLLTVLIPWFDPRWADVSPWLIGALCACVPLLLLQSYGNSLQLATDRVRDFNLVHLIQSGTFLPAFLLIWYLCGSTVGDVTTGIAFGRLVTAALMALLVVAMTSRFVRFRPRIHTDFLRDGLSYGWRANIVSVLTYLNLRLAPLLVVWLYARDQDANVALETVAKLTVAMTLAELVWHFPEATRDLFFSRVAGAQPEEARRLTPALCRICVLLAVAGNCAILPAGMVVIPWIVGATAWEEVWRVAVTQCLLLLMPGTTAFTLAKILQNDLAARGRINECIMATSLTLSTMVVGAFVLIPTYGAQGAAVASSFAYCVSALFTLVVYLRANPGVSWTECVFVRLSDWMYVQDIVAGVIAKLRRRPSTQQP